MLTLADKNAQRLSLLMNDILDMEKIASGKLEFQFAEHGLHELLEQALQANRGYAGQYKVSLALDYELHDGAKVRVDSGRLQQVMSNLNSNAVKYSPVGGEVRLHVDQQGARIGIEVIDQGDGIPLEFQPRYSRSSPRPMAPPHAAGTGLGLNITKSIIESMAGNIGFTSQIGQGTCFYISLPLRS